MTQKSKLADLLAGSMTKPSAARVYDYLIGGEHCFEVDRQFAATKFHRPADQPVAHAYGQVILEENGDPGRHIALRADLLDSHVRWQSVKDTGLIDLSGCQEQNSPSRHFLKVTLSITGP